MSNGRVSAHACSVPRDSLTGTLAYFSGVPRELNLHLPLRENTIDSVSGRQTPLGPNRARFKWQFRVEINPEIIRSPDNSDNIKPDLLPVQENGLDNV